MVGIININGEIGVDVHLADVVEQVARQRDATSYVFNIDSEGGSVEVGFDIYDYIKSIQKPTTTVGRGVVASIATVIFLAGKKREILKGTTFMIHMPALFDNRPKTVAELEADLNVMKRVESKIVNFYSKNLHIEKVALIRLLENETYLNERQLYAFGFTTEEKELRAVAKLNLNINKKKMSKKMTLLQKIRAIAGANILMKTYKTADQGELVFQGVDDDAEPQIGDSATLDGETPDGDVILANGDVYVFEEGVLVEILVAEEMDIEAEGLEEKLDEILEVQEALVEIVEEVSENVEEVKVEVEAKLRSIRAIQAKIQALNGVSSKTVEKRATARRTTTKGSSLSGAISNLRKNK